MSENIYYETLAKIVKNTEIKIPSLTEEEKIITGLNGLNNVLTETYRHLVSDVTPTVAGIKVLGPGVGTFADIAFSWNKEGPMQASITGILSTGATVTLGLLLFGTSAPASVPAAIGIGVTMGLINLATGKGFDKLYEFVEDHHWDIFVDSITGQYIIDTSLPSIDDITPLISSIMGAQSYTEEDLGLDNGIVVKQKVGDETITYEIKSGDTIWDICNKLGMSYEELIELNPWLKDRFSDDMKFALIRPGEKLKVPKGLAIGKPGFDVPFDIADGAGTPGVDPILVDLDGDGVISTTSVNNGRYFDHSKDGFSELSSWVSGNDGMLVIDKNNDGVINDGGEVFGDNYVKGSGSLASSGFDALSDLDSNGDGIISSLDDSFGLIKILKGDGSLISLEEAGIVSISLNNTSAGDDGNGIIDENRNTLVSLGSFVRGDGSIGSLGDFNLVVDKMDSVEVDKVSVSEDVALLPDVRGFGLVHSLHQAMMLDKGGELKGLVEKFVNSSSVGERRKLVDDILYEWGCDSKNTEGYRGSYFYDKTLCILEKFMGKKFVGVNNNGQPNLWATPWLDKSYAILANYVYYSLGIQVDGELKNIYNMIELEYSFDDNVVGYNFDKVIEYIDNIIKENKRLGMEKLLEVKGIAEAFGLNKTFCLNEGLINETSNNLVNGYDKFYEHFSSIDEEYRNILDVKDKIAFLGNNGGDSIKGTIGADIVFGGNGNDIIDTGEGADIIYGGRGDDKIHGGNGCNTIYGGDGNDTIRTGNKEDLIYGGDGNDSIISDYGYDTIYGGDGNDTIDGGNGNDLIYGGNGNDSIIGGSGDTIYGEDGNDYIKTEHGDAYLDGGDGNDTIRTVGYSGSVTVIGGLGDDYLESGQLSTYDGSRISNLFKYNLGDGNDTINAGSTNDTLEFGEGISVEDIRCDGDGNDLIIWFNNVDSNKEGSIRVKLELSSSTMIEKYVFSDGRELNKWQIIGLNGGLVKKGTEGNDIIKGSIASEKIYGYGGNDSIYGDYGNDTIYGGDGNDTIDGWHGDDLIYGGDGDDRIDAGRSGNDTIYGESGNDYIFANHGSCYLDGGDGNDTITGDDCNCIIIGGKGDDSLCGYGGGDNTYIYNLGDGNDTINDYYNKQNKDNDTLEFGEGISVEDIRCDGDGNDLIIWFNNVDSNKEGSIRVKFALGFERHRIENFKFSDGTVLSFEEIMEIKSSQEKNAASAAICVQMEDNKYIDNNRVMENILNIRKIEGFDNSKDLVGIESLNCINSANECGLDGYDNISSCLVTDYDVNKIIQDMAGYDNGMGGDSFCYAEDVNNEKDLMNLVGVGS